MLLLLLVVVELGLLFLLIKKIGEPIAWPYDILGLLWLAFLKPVTCSSKSGKSDGTFIEFLLLLIFDCYYYWLDDDWVVVVLEIFS